MDQLHLLPEFISNHPLLVGAFLVVLAMLIKAEFEHQTCRGYQLDPAGATRAMNNDARVIDVRSDAEFAKQHIKGAKQVPMSSAVERAKELGYKKDDTIVVYCNTGNTSSSVCRKLRKEGYSNVMNLKGGIVAWQDAKLPTTSK